MIRCSCGSPNLQTVDATPPHGQKLSCGDCGKFIKFQPKSKNAHFHQEIKFRLDSLKDKVSGWDSIFINSLIQQVRITERNGKIFKISPRQSECLKKIEGKLLINNTPNLDTTGGAR